MRFTTCLCGAVIVLFFQLSWEIDALEIPIEVGIAKEGLIEKPENLREELELSSVRIIFLIYLEKSYHKMKSSY